MYVRARIPQEVIHCCFSKELLMQYYPNVWQNIVADFQQNGASFNRIADLPFGTVRRGNKLRDELELCFSRSWKLNLIFESEQQDLIYQFSKNGAFSGLLSPATFYQFREELQNLEGEFFIFPLRDHVQNGRGAGNCAMELLLSFLKNPKYNVFPVLKFIEEHLRFGRGRSTAIAGRRHTQVPQAATRSGGRRAGVG